LHVVAKQGGLVSNNGGSCLIFWYEQCSPAMNFSMVLSVLLETYLVDREPRCTRLFEGSWQQQQCTSKTLC